MEEMMEKLIAETGIDKGTAQKVVDFMKQHIDEVPTWIAQSGLAHRLPGNLQQEIGSLFGSG